MSPRRADESMALITELREGSLEAGDPAGVARPVAEGHRSHTPNPDASVMLNRGGDAASGPRVGRVWRAVGARRAGASWWVPCPNPANCQGVGRAGAPDGGGAGQGRMPGEA